MTNFDLLYGTKYESKALQALDDEKLEQNPTMLVVWVHNWTENTKIKHDQRLMESLTKQLDDEGKVCVLGDEKQHKKFIISNKEQ